MNEKPSITLPVLALVFIFVCFPVGVVLSIISLVKFHNVKGSDARTLSWVAFGLNFALIIPVIGILAAIAIPNFVMYECRSKQSEAKISLKSIYTMQEGFRAETDRYSSDLNEIRFTPMATKQRYSYAIVEATPTAFRAEARGMGEMAGDVWTIDNTNNLQMIETACD